MYAYDYRKTFLQCLVRLINVLVSVEATSETDDTYTQTPGLLNPILNVLITPLADLLHKWEHLWSFEVCVCFCIM